MAPPDTELIFNPLSKKKLDAIRVAGDLIPPVIDFYDPGGGLPADPHIGDRYISGDTAGGWEVDHVYEWDGEVWVESEPEEGWMLWMIVEFMLYFFFSGGWTAIEHGGLTGLTHDDHLHYALVDGTRPFTGTISSDTDSTDDLGTSSIYWANLYTDQIYTSEISTPGGINLVLTATTNIISIGASPTNNNILRFYQGSSGTSGFVAEIRADYNNLYLTNDNGRIFIEKAVDEAHSLGIQEAGSPYEKVSWWFDGASGTGTGVWMSANYNAGDINLKLGNADAATWDFKIIDWWDRELVTINSLGGAHFNIQSKDADFIIEGDTEANLFRLDAGTDTVRMGDWDSNYVKIDKGGDMVFVGNAGLPYGECFGDHIDWTQASAVQDQWYAISDSDMISDELNLVTHNGNGQLTLTNAGVYMVTYGIVITSSHANEHLHFGIEINDSGTPHIASHTHMETKFANQETSVSHTSLITVTAGQTINAMISTTDVGTPDISVEDLHITVVQVGG